MLYEVLKENTLKCNASSQKERLLLLGGFEGTSRVQVIFYFFTKIMVIWYFHF